MEKNINGEVTCGSVSWIGRGDNGVGCRTAAMMLITCAFINTSGYGTQYIKSPLPLTRLIRSVGFPFRFKTVNSPVRLKRCTQYISGIQKPRQMENAVRDI